MRFGSVCSGIEAASVAWQPLGWKAQWLSEIEPFPCALLAHHYPDTPNLGDMTKFESWPTDDQHAIDLLCGGTPCQSFSVAGLRKGLDDPRGNLMLTFGAIAAKYRPQWLVWENVPGVLSSNGGRDFGSFLGLLGFLGYGFAYRVLDAQYFGVAQRRRRVFVVGCAGDWRRAAAVLFERHSLSGHPAPSRQAGKKPAPTIAGCANGGGANGPGRDVDSVGSLQVVFGVDCFNGLTTGDAACTLTSGGVTDAFSPAVMVPAQDPAFPLGACPGAYRSYGEGQFNYITHTLRGKGFDASEDGTGRGTPLVPVAFVQNSRDEVRLMNGDGGIVGALVAEAGAKQQCYIAQPISFGAQMSVPQVDFNLNQTLQAKNPMAVDFQSSQSGVRIGDTHATLDANNGPRRYNGALQGMQVRRLTPRECERLQGFPDDYTLVPNRGKPAADGPRYKALGNSWAVPNVRWIGERIAAVAAIKEAV